MLLPMAAKPKEEASENEPLPRRVPEPVGDGFPLDDDISAPPPGSDQAEDRPDLKAPR